MENVTCCEQSFSRGQTKIHFSLLLACKAQSGPRASDQDSLAGPPISCAPRTFSLRTSVGLWGARGVTASSTLSQIRSRVRSTASTWKAQSTTWASGSRRGAGRRAKPSSRAVEREVDPAGPPMLYMMSIAPHTGQPTLLMAKPRSQKGATGLCPETTIFI
jgi:hypothetical protein